MTHGQQWGLGLSIGGSAALVSMIWCMVAMAAAPHEAPAKPKAPPVASAPAAPAPVNCNELLSRVDCQHMMRGRLAFPDTAEFSGILFGDQVTCNADGSNARYVSSVKATNAFNVPITTRYMCTLDKSKAMQLTVLQ